MRVFFSISWLFELSNNFRNKKFSDFPMVVVEIQILLTNCFRMSGNFSLKYLRKYFCATHHMFLGIIYKFWIQLSSNLFFIIKSRHRQPIFFVLLQKSLNDFQINICFCINKVYTYYFLCWWEKKVKLILNNIDFMYSVS